MAKFKPGFANSLAQKLTPGKARQHESALPRASDPFAASPLASIIDFEPLENRRLMSAVHSAFGGGRSSGQGGPGGGFGGGGAGGAPGGGGPASSEIVFSLAPTAVQTGLTSLASTDGDTAPTSTTEVYLGNSNGVETYSIHESSSGTSSTLTVDLDGNSVTAPTQTTTTFGAITNTAVTSELTAIANADGLTAPTSSSTVNVSTASDGSVTYSISLSSDSTATSSSTSTHTHSTVISVDVDGNPVGQQIVPLSVLSTAIQNGLTANAPTGATALTSTSKIQVQTVDGVTLYTTTYSSTGTKTTVSVNSAGTLTSLPTTTTTTFSAIPTAAQTELLTLATADGVTTTIAADQTVTETTESNGITLYSVKLTSTSSSDSSDTYPITITVDATGNPTVLDGGFGGSGFGGGGFGGGMLGGSGFC